MLFCKSRKLIRESLAVASTLDVKVLSLENSLALLSVRTFCSLASDFFSELEFAIERLEFDSLSQLFVDLLFIEC